jgi:cold shock CspA family protein
VRPLRTRRGRVARFDEARGLGTVRSGDGEEVGFHCTAVADGSRTVPEGAEVEYEVVPGHLGRWEAASVRPLGHPRGGPAVEPVREDPAQAEAARKGPAS